MIFHKKPSVFILMMLRAEVECQCALSLLATRRFHEQQPQMSLKELCAYETPSVTEMQNFMLADRRPTGHVNQVWPNVYIGNEIAARDKSMLYNMGITHIVNAASGPPHVNTGPRFYRDMAIDYYGVEADDSSDFIISVFFYPTARFIRAALSKNEKLLKANHWPLNCIYIGSTVSAADKQTRFWTR
ncbi:dual specificity protein phosphatase 13 isoform X3 [Puntigrus tetrazona]|uniref:dual specificity protein phosphatase 13 isoform X3 n=1 Tax=Puntigrus tetrazona TaxID=1606681 RepID=UPI001C88ECEF|nr:dual specificity protein phosphatase 13 isoform X3 [Puntigrus tetrazona]